MTRYLTFLCTWKLRWVRRSFATHASLCKTLFSDKLCQTVKILAVEGLTSNFFEPKEKFVISITRSQKNNNINTEFMIVFHDMFKHRNCFVRVLLSCYPVSFCFANAVCISIFAMYILILCVVLSSQ